MSNRDIVIVGAGPGGLLAAKRAAELGLDTLLLEKQYEIGYPVRTSGGSYTKEMESLGIPPRHYNPVRRAVLATVGKQVEFSYPENEGCILDIRGAYQFLAMEAARKGCQIEVGTTVKGGLKDGGSIVGVVASKLGRDMQVRAPVVIDASGFSAVLARDAGLLPLNWTRFGLGFEYEAYIEHLEKDTAYLLVGDTIAPSGYAWVFPLSDERARIGVGITKPVSDLSPSVLMDHLLSTRPSILQELGRIIPIEAHAGTVPIEPVPAKTTADGLIVLGDAACQANPIVGEGIRLAMKFGGLAAEVAAQAIQDGDFRAQSFANYEREVKKTARDNKIALSIHHRISGYSQADWEESIDGLKRFTPKEFQSYLKAEFSNKNLLAALLRHPIFAASTTLKLLKEKL